eukprot:6214531-Pleurochrysis_carterae.AAC.4
MFAKEGSIPSCSLLKILDANLKVKCLNVCIPLSAIVILLTGRLALAVAYTVTEPVITHRFDRQQTRKGYKDQSDS